MYQRGERGNMVVGWGAEISGGSGWIGGGGGGAGGGVGGGGGGGGRGAA